MKLDIIIVGVGGQGILTCSMIVAKAAMNANLNVITSEVHGMAQRGGSVEVHVRIGDVLSPLIPIGDADIMIALEPVEALRYAKYLNENSLVILNTRPVIPVTVTLGNANYPSIHEIVEKLKEITPKVVPVDASVIAEKLGSIQSTNIVILGMLAKLAELPFNYEHLEQAIREILPPTTHDINLRAFKEGLNYIYNNKNILSKNR